jgi:methylthioribose-1-phosphate isomerase
VQWVIVGADRITANGDVANKIGTYNLAVNARYHGVKFMVVAPTSTVDMALDSGHQITIEQRDPNEVLNFQGHAVSPRGVNAWNPAFDITPAGLIDVIVTEQGVVEQPAADSMMAMMKNTA